MKKSAIKAASATPLIKSIQSRLRPELAAAVPVPVDPAVVLLDVAEAGEFGALVAVAVAVLEAVGV